MKKCGTRVGEMMKQGWNLTIHSRPLVSDFIASIKNTISGLTFVQHGDTPQEALERLERFVSFIRN